MVALNSLHFPASRFCIQRVYLLWRLLRLNFACYCVHNWCNIICVAYFFQVNKNLSNSILNFNRRKSKIVMISYFTVNAILSCITVVASIAMILHTKRNCKYTQWYRYAKSYISIFRNKDQRKKPNPNVFQLILPSNVSR